MKYTLVEVLNRRAGETLKRFAYRVMYWAINNGLLIRKRTCERCGLSWPLRKIVPHHPDYKKTAVGTVALWLMS